MPIFATIIENSPRDTSVKPIFVEALWDNPALRPAIIPAVKLPIRVMKTAPNANQTAPPSENGSMLKPKLKRIWLQRNHGMGRQASQFDRYALFQKRRVLTITLQLPQRHESFLKILLRRIK